MTSSEARAHLQDLDSSLVLEKQSLLPLANPLYDYTIYTTNLATTKPITVYSPLRFGRRIE